MKKFSSISSRLYHLVKNLIKPSWYYLKQGYHAKLLPLYCKHFVVRHLQEFSAALKENPKRWATLKGQE